MTKDALRLLVLFSLVALMGTACGNDDDTNDTDTDDTDTETDTTDTEDPANSPDDYENGIYMTNSAWLMEHYDDAGLKILDARSAEAYAEGHIQNARNVMWQQFANVAVKPGEEGFGVVLAPEELSEALAAVDIESDDTIVVVADPLNGWGDDGRIVWMLH